MLSKIVGVSILPCKICGASYLWGKFPEWNWLFISTGPRECHVPLKYSYSPALTERVPCANLAFLNQDKHSTCATDPLSI